MRAIFDTSSFECIMKYYIPIDRNGELKELIEENFKVGEFILIDKVFKEICNYESGIIFKTFPLLKDKKLIVNTNFLIPTTAFYNQMANFFDEKIVTKKNLSPATLDVEMNAYLNQADGRLLMYAHSIILEKPIIVTEETVKPNDGKHIRKIPYNCSFLNLDCCSFPNLLKDNFSINIASK